MSAIKYILIREQNACYQLTWQIYQKTGVEGGQLRDSFIDRLLATQAWGPQFDDQNPR